MKNKLLKISALFVFIAFSGLFLYQKDSSQEAGLEGQSRDNKINSKNHKSNPTVLKVEKEPIVSAPIKAEQIFNNRKKVSTIAKIQDVTTESVSVLSEKQLDSVEKLRAKYENFIVNHPNRKSMALPKSDRKAIGLPPNKYNEQDWLYSADPNLGRPTPEITLAIQKDLNDKLESGRVPGDGMDNQWVERGPNNVGGRTRALMFAPGSATKVFAGATSGGLWINNDITNAASSWTQVSGVPSNMSVTCITVDPQDANIMYIGTGEVYTWGAVNGNGVYKSIDAGVTWRNVFSTSDAVNINDRLTFIQAIIAWRNPTTNLTEVYFGADAMNVNYAGGLTPGGATETFGRNTIGVWRSTDGVNFARQTTASLLYTAGKYVTADSFTIDSVGNLFMGTKYSYVNAGGGGKIYKCTTGVDWALVRTLASANGRVQLVASKTTAGRMVALCENASTGLPVIRRSTDAFATVDTSVPLPVSSGVQPPAATDFCRGQAFYDLMIGMNPTNDSEVYVAGIEIFRNTQMFKTTPVAADWVQLTDWTVDPTATGNAAASTLDGVHSDHHVMAFASGLTNRVTFGCDGGIYYSNDSGNAIGVRNNGYNVTQFYKAGINQSGAQKLLAGAQDNGSQLISPAPAAVGSSVEVFGGDGCWEFIDKQNEFMVTSYVYNSYFFTRYDTEIATTYIANDYGGSDGDFVNQCGLDSNANILFANGTAGATYQIYRYAINPAGNGATTTSTLTNALLTSIPTYFEASPYTANNLLVGLANGRLIKVIRSNGPTTGPAGSQPAYSSIGDASWVGTISDIRFGASDNELFVTFHNHGITSVWYSSNGGTSWVSKEGDLPNLSVKCILQNPNATNEVIVGTNLGVWYTVNFNAASPNWRRANNGMKDVPVLSFDYRSADRVILAATYARGMWTGEFWQCGTTTKTWDGTTWSPAGAPTKRDAVVFNGNYTSTASLDACSVTVNAGAAVTFVSGHSLRVGENITVNATGSLTINSGAALVQYTKHAVNTGNIIVKRTSTNMVRNDYTAWSSPVVNQNLLAFSPNTVATRFYQYLFTGTTTPTAYQSVVPSTNSFSLAKGYMIRVDNNWTTTPAAFNGQFTGVPNNGTITYAVGQGYNLLGNPYASPISAYRFLITNPKVNTVYYWTHTVAAVAGAFPQNNYASYTTLGGTASAAGGAIPNDKINVGQGFFIQAAAAYTVTFENELREDASTTTQFFRSSDNNEEKNRIWLNLNDGTKSYNQILVGYTANATDGIDSKIDGKMLDTSKTSLYNLIENKEYVIQGKGLPFSDDDVVKLGLKVTEASNFEINIQQVDGLFENQEVFVKDNYTNAIHNLKEGSYYFISQVGTFNDRFELIYKKPTKEVEVVATNSVDVLVKNNELSIQTYQSAMASIEVYDVLGKVVFTKNGINNKQFNTNQITASNQALLVKIQLENGEVVVKKIIM